VRLRSASERDATRLEAKRLKLRALRTGTRDQPLEVDIGQALAQARE